jgi:hypothetical protein
MAKNIVTYNQLGRYGRLANQMFQIASTIGIARKNGFDFAFPYWKNYDHAERFGSTEDIDIQKYFENPLPLYNGPALPDQFVHWGYQEVKLRNSCSLSGHMQSFKFFAHCFDEVKYYFRMKDEYPQNDFCAIHVRLGDYDNAYHPRLDMRYYAEAMAQFPKETKFYVFSDEVDSAFEYLTGAGRRIFKYDSGSYIDDFKMMKSCRHFIIGNSSYSAMAAILGEAKDKRVIAPAPWFGPKHTDITAKDIYRDDWTVINYEQARQFSQVDTSTNAYMGNKKEISK